MSSPSQTPPGWYPNADGMQQWWDGQHWGPIAPQPAVSAQFAVSPPVYQAVLHPKYKSMGAAYCLLIFLGGIGLHRFYLDNDARGFVMVALFLLTVVFAVVFPPVSVLCLITLWIMQIIDLFTLAADVTRFNARLYSGM